MVIHPGSWVRFSRECPQLHPGQVKVPKEQKNGCDKFNDIAYGCLYLTCSSTYILDHTSTPRCRLCGGGCPKWPVIPSNMERVLFINPDFPHPGFILKPWVSLNFWCVRPISIFHKSTFPLCFCRGEKQGLRDSVEDLAHLRWDCYTLLVHFSSLK